MIIGRRTRYLLLGIALALILLAAGVCLALKFGTTIFEHQAKQQKKQCIFPIQLPTILNVTSNLVTGRRGVIKVFVHSEYPIHSYWEERQGYSIGGRSSVSYLIPATEARGYTSILQDTGNGRYKIVLRMRSTPYQNGRDNLSLHLIQITPCNNFILNFDPLDFLHTKMTLPKIVRAPLPKYDIKGKRFKLRFVANVRNSTNPSKSFRSIFGGTFVRFSWTEGELIKSVHSNNEEETQKDVTSRSYVIKSEDNPRQISIKTHVEFKDFGEDNSGLYAVGFIMYTHRFAALKVEMYTDLQLASRTRKSPAIRVESCSDIMSPRTERDQAEKVQELAAVQGISNCVRITTSGHLQPELAMFKLQGKEYNDKSVRITSAKSGRPLSGSYESKTFSIRNPDVKKPDYYLIRAKNDVKETSVFIKVVSYRPVELVDFYVKGAPRTPGHSFERTDVWYDVPTNAEATLLCKATGHPRPTIRFFSIPAHSNQTDSVFALDPKIGDSTWDRITPKEGVLIRPHYNNRTNLMTSSITLKKGFFDDKTDFIIACLVENRFFLNRKKIGFHVIR